MLNLNRVKHKVFYFSCFSSKVSSITINPTHVISFDYYFRRSSVMVINVKPEKVFFEQFYQLFEVVVLGAL